MTGSAPKRGAFFSLVVAVVSWASAPVFIKLLADAYDPYTQAFVRYTAASIVMLTVCLVFYRKELGHILRTKPLALALVAGINVGSQIIWTLSCYWADAATMPQLVIRLSVVMVVILSFFLFHEERAVIRHPLFLTGTAISFVGVAAVIATDPASLIPQFDRAALAALGAALGLALYMVSSKHVVLGMNAIPMFGVVATFTALGLGISSLVAGDMTTAIEADARTTLIAFISGIIPMAIAHPSYNYAQKHLGSAFCSSFIFLMPLCTYLMALAFLPDERLLWTQWVGGGILIGGTALVVYVAHRVHRRGQVQ